jgi:hypothetical protein
MIKGRIDFKVNRAELKREILTSTQRLNTRANIENSLMAADGTLLKTKLQKMIKDMVKDFLSHPVTKEILSGPNASNTSGTLGGYGNLFSFIGFEAGTNPITPIIELLEQTNYRFTRMEGGKVDIIVEMPSKDDIFKATPLPWAPGLSWAERIEIGLSGLGQYLNTPSPYSRSGHGIQSSKVKKGGAFKNTKYISDFIKRWQKQFLSVATTVK